MLVLTRHIGEEIVIDGNIQITVTAIHGRKVRLGLTAPPGVRVDRKEVYVRRRQVVSPASCPTDRMPAHC